MLTEGIFPCVVLSATYGGNAETGVPTVRINVKFTDGPNAGRLATYEDEVNAKSAKYIGYSCKAVGWRGASLRTLVDDCDAWIATTGGKTDAEIKHIEIKRGKKYDKWVADGADPAKKPIWDKCSGIGRGPKPLATVKPTDAADADEAMRNAFAGEPGSDADEDSPF